VTFLYNEQKADKPSSCGSSWQNTAIEVLKPPVRLLAKAEP